ncbi:MAG: glycoside hydrolase family 13 protein [Ignavibacteriae bacterium]|nr:glycoside hydrolase family 13 protein [Ignavibacteriota bacterium]
MTKLKVPDWTKDAIWYQIFPERFANGDSSIDPPNVEKWGGKPKRQNYFGGDLKGIIEHLNYLQELGINALYLNPIFESNTNHKYHATDYYKIDDNFGTEETFKQLLSECHKRNIRVIIDGVFNHTGRDFFAFDDIIKNEANSKYINWYKVHSFPVGPASKPNYECWWGYGDLPKLMADTPEVRKYLFDVTKYWMKTGLDGWRLDVPNEMSHDFWIEWCKLVKEVNPDAYIVGELWEDATPWLQGNEFHAVMNYRFRNAVIDYFVNELTNVTEFDSVLKKIREDYPEEASYAMQNLIGSHDTERFLTLMRGDVDKMRVAVLFQMTYLGAPMVYYGDEIGMEGGKDPDCRRTMPWDESQWDTDLQDWYRKLIKIRNEVSVLRRGSFKTALVDDEGEMYGFWREDGNDAALVLFNNDEEDRTISITATGQDVEWTDKLNSVSYKKDGSEIKDINIPALSGVVLVPKR